MLSLKSSFSRRKHVGNGYFLQQELCKEYFSFPLSMLESQRLPSMVIPDSESGMIFVDAAFQWESKIELGVWK